MKINSLYAELAFIFFASLILRIISIHNNPAVYAYDAYIYLLGISQQYPVFTGLLKLFSLFSFSAFTIRIIVSVFSASACTVFFLFCFKLFSRKSIARIAVLLFAIYPPFFIFSIVPYTEPLFFVFFFTGLLFFENELGVKSRYFPKTGLFITLACLTRYEATLVVPLLFFRTRVISYSNNDLSNKKFGIILTALPSFLSLVLPPLIFLILYNTLISSELADTQSKEIYMILKNIVVLFSGIIDSFIKNFLPNIFRADLGYSVFAISFGLLFSLFGCIAALKENINKHLIYIIFIALATLIQFLPIASSFRIYQGKIIGLRRAGIVPSAFLIFYFSFFIDFILHHKLFLKIKIFLILLFVGPVLSLLIFASCHMNTYLLNDYQKLYRNSYIDPHWIGGHDDQGRGIIVSVEEPILKMHLSGKTLKKYSVKTFLSLDKKEIGDFIKKNKIKYVIVQRRHRALFDSLSLTEIGIRLRPLAKVGGWLFVYVLENR